MKRAAHLRDSTPSRTAALVPAARCHHSRIRVATDRPTQFIDLTTRIEALAADADIDVGLVNIQSLHTTTAIVVNEHEPLLLTDFEALLTRTAPTDAVYRHDDMDVRTVNLAPGERANGHAHCQALLLGQSASLNLADGRLQLGRWQRVFLVELDGPRVREVSVLILGESLR
jgi:secondary thiamine-phosphate synthase enzyme